MATRKNVSLADLLQVVMDKDVPDAEVGRVKLNLTLQSFRGRLKGAMEDNVEAFIGYEADMQRFLGKPRLDVDQIIADTQGITIEEFRQNRTKAISDQAADENDTIDSIYQRYIDRQTSNNEKSAARKVRARTLVKKEKDATPAKRGRPKKSKENMLA